MLLNSDFIDSCDIMQHNDTMHDELTKDSKALKYAMNSQMNDKELEYNPEEIMQY
jgi:hypothetical protein